ncbi:hypothetical protein [Maledivibacter halophilus]|nr:hypothetical protein [Maledivibacter halophilus]
MFGYCGGGYLIPFLFLFGGGYYGPRRCRRPTYYSRCRRPCRPYRYRRYC